MHRLCCFLIPCLLGLGDVAGALLGAEGEPFEPGLYAFQNGVGFGSIENEARTLSKLGYAGISQVKAGGDKLAERIAVYEKLGLKVLSIYLNVDDRPVSADLVKPLANRGALIELTVRKMTPKTVEAVRQTAETADQLGIRVALYPHHGFAVARMPEAMDLIRRVNHPNLGVMFNLCHFLKGERAEDLERVLEKARSHLFAVSISGADLGGRTWGDLIKPLDQGNFPQMRVLRALKKVGFRGSVALQCYGVRGDKRANLQRSMAAWKELMGQLQVGRSRIPQLDGSRGR